MARKRPICEFDEATLAAKVDVTVPGDLRKKAQVCVGCDPDRGPLIVVRDPGPGFDPSQIEIKTFSDRVNVRSNVEESSEGENDGRTWYMRRGNRTMNLSVTLPTEVDPESAQASFKNGVITVRLPESRAVQGRVLELRQE